MTCSSWLGSAAIVHGSAPATQQLDILSEQTSQQALNLRHQDIQVHDLWRKHLLAADSEQLSSE